MELLNSVTAFLHSEGFLRTLGILGGLGVLDMALKLKQSEKPLGVLIALSAFLKSVGNFCLAVDGTIEKLIPAQRLKVVATGEPEKK